MASTGQACSEGPDVGGGRANRSEWKVGGPGGYKGEVDREGLVWGGSYCRHRVLCSSVLAEPRSRGAGVWGARALLVWLCIKS